MKKFFIGLAVVAVVAGAALAVTSAASAQDPVPGMPGFGRGPRGGQYGGGMHGGQMPGQGFLSEYMHAAMADALGISEADFESRLENGEHFYEIAADLGFDADAIQALHIQARETALAQALADGVITQEQVDSMQGHGACGGGYGPGFGNRWQNDPTGNDS